MKRLLILTAIAGAALVSCTKNELAPSATEQQEISFASPVMSPSTKVAEVADDYPKSNKFSVWAHYYDDTNDGGKYTEFADGEVYMNEVEVGYNETLKGWRHETKTYYWPKNGSLTFIAYSPSSAASYADVDAKGIKFTDYVVGDPESQVDLLFSERAYNKETVDQVTGDADPYAGVQISFKHALSSIMFKVKAAAKYAGTTLTVTKIEVLNAYSVGDFTQGLTDGNENLTPAVATNFGWSGQETERAYIAYESATGIVLSDTEIKYAHSGLKTPIDNTTDLILLPQALDHTTNDVTIKVTYTLKNSDMSKAIVQTGEISLVTGNSGGYFKDGTDNNIESWERGKRYVYTISVGLDEIYFDPKVEVWKNVEATPDLSI